MILKKGSKGSEVRELQKLLHLYEDGIFGPLTEEAVREFQRVNNLTVDGIVGEKTWVKLKEGLTKSARIIKEIIVHCSATKEGQDFTIADIKRWHLARGFSDIGYHYVIYRDGSIHTGRKFPFLTAFSGGEPHQTAFLHSLLGAGFGCCPVYGCFRRDGVGLPAQRRGLGGDLSLSMGLFKNRRRSHGLCSAF